MRRNLIHMAVMALIGGRPDVPSFVQRSLWPNVHGPAPARVVRVRFRGASSEDLVFDFQEYLRPSTEAQRG